MLEVLDYTIRIGSTPTILYFDLYLTLPTQHTMFISLWLTDWVLKFDSNAMFNFDTKRLLCSNNSQVFASRKKLAMKFEPAEISIVAS